MSADEVGGQAVLLAEGQELWHPGVLSGRRAADSKRCIHALDRFDGVTIELEVVFLLTVAEGFEIRFVPDFKKPAADLGQAIALDPVTNQLPD